MVPAMTPIVLAQFRIDPGFVFCHPECVTLQPQIRSLIAWTVLAALAVVLVVAVNLSVHVQAI
jgi:alkylhydroperoxidase/carboxymuconolactone decarboxylase family protein YurZ